MPSQLKRSHGRITPAEASRAIYVDCEGLKNSAPSLLGILVDGTFESVMVDERLASAAIARQQRCVPLAAVASELLARCRSEGRVLVAYSQHELRLFLTYAAIDFYDVYRDARMIAGRWWTCTHPHGRRKDRKLKTYLRSIGHAMPAHLGSGTAAARLRAVVTMLERRGSYRALTPVTKRKWRHLLAYNEHDCRGMEALVCRAVDA